MYRYAFNLLDRNNKRMLTRYVTCKGYVEAVQQGMAYFVTSHEVSIDYKSLLITSVKDGEQVFYATFTPDSNLTTKN